MADEVRDVLAEVVGRQAKTFWKSKQPEESESDSEDYTSDDTEPNDLTRSSDLTPWQSSGKLFKQI